MKSAWRIGTRFESSVILEGTKTSFNAGSPSREFESIQYWGFAIKINIRERDKYVCLILSSKRTTYLLITQAN